MYHPSHDMQLALTLAERGRYSVSPNPMVGCVIVRNHKIVGQGYHQKAGLAHAEILALQEARENARGATLYLTLEPCCHYGRTPPCTDALIAAGIAKVVVACLDPNPKVHGRGVALLRKAGIEVEVGLMEAEAQRLNEVFFHYIKTLTPFVTLKWAMSLDGQTITQPGDSRQLSNHQSIQHAHQLRWAHDAIMVGAQTIRDDNPLLTARHQPDVIDAQYLKQPLRVIVASQGDLPLDSQVFCTLIQAPTCVITGPNANQSWLAEISKKGVEVITVPERRPHELDVNSILIELGRKKITSVLVEGGMSLHQSFMRAKRVNKIVTYLANALVGNMSHKQRVHIDHYEQLQEDICMTAYPISSSD